MTTVLTFDWKIWLTLLIVLALIVMDFLLGVLTNLKTLSIQKLPGQLVNFVLPFFLPLLALGIVEFISPLLNTIGVTVAVAGTFYAFAGTVALKALDDIMGKVGVSFGSSPSVTPVVVVPPANPPA